MAEAKITQVNPTSFELEDYSVADENLISSIEVETLFNPQTDYIEYFVYNPNNGGIIYPPKNSPSNYNEYTLEEPNADNIHTMITTLMYKLNCNPCLANGLGNTWENLAPLVDNNERDRLENIGDDPDVTTQTLEGYVVEDISLKNKVSRLQEYFDDVGENGLIQLDDNLWIDGRNSDIFP